MGAVYHQRRRVVALCVFAVLALTLAGLSAPAAPLSMPLLVAPWLWCTIELLRWSAHGSRDGGRRPASPAAVADAPRPTHPATTLVTAA